MKISKNIFLYSLLICLCIYACDDKKKQQTADTADMTEYEQYVTSSDTADVKALVDEFFTYVKDKRYSVAAAMLYRNDKDPKAKPEQLEQEEMDRVIKMLQILPITDYRIEYYKFEEYYKNEVMCSIIISPAKDGMPELTSKFFFKPINYLGVWCLCLTESAYGDKGITEEQRDRLILGK